MLGALRMRIGSLTIDTPVLLAPMAAVTDLPFRTICERFGVGLTITEFLKATALCDGDAEVVDKLTASLDGVRFGVQIYGREVEPLVQAAQLALDIGASLIDINMGCPAKRVVAGECGAALMQWPELSAELVRAVVASVPDSVPVTVKHRAGWNPLNRNAPEFACAMVEAGAQMVTVHGRTRTQGFAGSVDLEVIRRVREAVPARVPVVGNGDVVCVDDYLRMREHTGCDAVMIGRGALGNPWLFRSLHALAHGLPDPGRPDMAERYRVFCEHVALLYALKGGPKLIHEVRKACAWYAKGLDGADGFRQHVWKLRSPDEVLVAAAAFFGRPYGGASVPHGLHCATPNQG
ncbi:tRNA dihydrouridine synthase DusB [Haliangium ochraceum]|uniref:tRNA-dihydrouridine synthase n=1 Tax=Haliangium ochraceum (strain DSM 14365 / JCM 11303 / SMP-2) TaxID=502025 RepID=D0LJX3_HALO1|nr:tRNA dihydrouridine synthase DusB [Haliangium ochraceum]ACY18480.1 TIM-barrel protein, nifR3 family [Haliangium ochraceum DSM 14365]